MFLANKNGELQALRKCLPPSFQPSLRRIETTADRSKETGIITLCRRKWGEITCLIAFYLFDFAEFSAFPLFCLSPFLSSWKMIFGPIKTRPPKSIRIPSFTISKRKEGNEIEHGRENGFWGLGRLLKGENWIDFTPYPQVSILGVRKSVFEIGSFRSLEHDRDAA